jgi:hypothetical protein
LMARLLIRWNVIEGAVTVDDTIGPNF